MSRENFGYSVYPYLRLFFVCLLLSAVFILSSGEPAQSQLMQDADTPPAVSVPPDTLWDQTSGISSTDITSQDFTDGGGFDIYDSRAADDFLVPEGFIWVINTVRVFGAFDDNTPEIIDTLDLDFYVDRDGLPGHLAAKCVYDNILPEDITDPNFIINLTRPCRLEPGVYWVSVRANIGFIQNGQWFWHENSVQRLSPFAWENPGDGFSTGCVRFTPAQADCGASEPDLSFQIIGRETAIIRPIPTLGEWGMISAAAILGLFGIGAIVLYRGKRVDMKNC